MNKLVNTLNNRYVIAVMVLLFLLGVARMLRAKV